MPISPAGSNAGATGCRRRSFTFVETLVVCAIVALVAAVVIPRSIRSSRRMTVENALSVLRGAFVECAMRSRASGEALVLRLQPQERLITVTKGAMPLQREWRPPAANITVAPGTGILPGRERYELPEVITWTALPGDYPLEGIEFAFYPDGEATGPTLDFQVLGTNYRLVIDSVIGKATILEME